MHLAPRCYLCCSILYLETYCAEPGRLPSEFLEVFGASIDGWAGNLHFPGAVWSDPVRWHTHRFCIPCLPESHFKLLSCFTRHDLPADATQAKITRTTVIHIDVNTPLAAEYEQATKRSHHVIGAKQAGKGPTETRNQHVSCVLQKRHT